MHVISRKKLLVFAENRADAFDKNIYGSLLAEFQPKIVTTEEENEQYLEIVEGLMGRSDRPPEQDVLLDLLVLLIEKFEDERYQLHGSTPRSILQHLMEVRGIEPEDLVGAIGSREAVSEIVDGQQSISEAQAQSLAEFFRVPPELFVRA
jgi:HTH-type transcriptional regulator/antitoxin HigA